MVFISAHILTMRLTMYFKIINNITPLLVFSIVLTACNESSVVSNSTVTQLENASQIDSRGGNYSITFSPSTHDIPLNQYFDMDVNITGSTKQVLAYPVALEIDAGMKAHNHGMNVNPKVNVLGNGHFKVEGMLLHMPGDWFLSFIVRRGAMSDKAGVNLVVSP